MRSNLAPEEPDYVPTLGFLSAPQMFSFHTCRSQPSEPFDVPPVGPREETSVHRLRFMCPSTPRVELRLPSSPEIDPAVRVVFLRSAIRKAWNLLSLLLPLFLPVWKLAERYAIRTQIHGRLR